jgi:hypothetical protein
VQLLEDLQDVTIVQNTFFGAGAANDLMFDGAAMSRLVLANNVFGRADYGILGSGFGEGTSSLAHFAPGAVVTGNVFSGATAAAYPVGNAFPGALSLVDFVNAAGGNFTLRPALLFSIQNGNRTGVDGASVVSVTSGVTAR